MKTNKVKAKAIAEYLQTCMDRLSGLIDDSSRSLEPYKALEASYYDLLRRTLRDVGYEIGLFSRHAANISLNRADVLRAVLDVLSRNATLKNKPETHAIVQEAYTRIDMTIRQGMNQFV